MRRYRISHLTRYTYAEEVTESYGRAYLTPREDQAQRLLDHIIEVSPDAALATSEIDVYGNASTYTEVLSEHTELRVAAHSVVEVSRARPELDALTIPVAVAVQQADQDYIEQNPLWGKDFLLPSRHVPADAEVSDFAAQTLAPGQGVAQAVLELMHRIFREVRYAPGVSTVSTTPIETLRRRQGVCQDMAHLMLAGLRSVGLPARYVSGYLETIPPPGAPRLVGADASHAWVSVWLPGPGWVDLDPTNDQLVDESYVALAWGRDYADVTPLRGVVYTTGATLGLEVSVDVERIPADQQDGE